MPPSSVSARPKSKPNLLQRRTVCRNVLPLVVQQKQLPLARRASSSATQRASLRGASASRPRLLLVLLPRPPPQQICPLPRQICPSAPATFLLLYAVARVLAKALPPLRVAGARGRPAAESVTCPPGLKAPLPVLLAVTLPLLLVVLLRRMHRQEQTAPLHVAVTCPLT